MKAIENFDKYFADESGNIYSMKPRWFNVKAPTEPRLLIPLKNSDGYLYVNLYRDGKKHTLAVHSIVLKTFVGDRPDGMQARHFPDRNPENNALENLRWDTPKNNCADRKIHGTLGVGEKAGNVKLTEAKVIKIREDYKSGVSQRKIAERNGVNQQSISNVVRRITWSHI